MRYTAFLLTLLVLAPVAYAQDATRRHSSRLPRENPCTGTQSIERQLCLMDLRKSGGVRVDERMHTLVRENIGRRAQVLRNADERRRSIFVPGALDRTQLGLTDPRPAGERTKAVYDPYARLKQTDRPLLRSQVRAGNRKFSATFPLCARRDGIRLIGCLLELGIEINEQTADTETLEIWERIQH